MRNSSTRGLHDLLLESREILEEEVLTRTANDTDGDREASEGLVDDALHARPTAEVETCRGEDERVILGCQLVAGAERGAEREGVLLCDVEVVLGLEVVVEETVSWINCLCG